MNYLKYLLFSIFIIGMSSCSSTQYLTDSLGSVDASQFASYTLEDNCGDDINPIMQIRIKNAIQKTLRVRNLTNNENANLLVKYFVKNTNKKYVQECRDDYLRWEGGRKCIDRVISYEEGSIVVDMIDTRTNTIIWHGAAYGPSWDRLSDPDKHINGTVSNLLDRFFTPQ
ncbi:MAG: hypothetical protein ACJA1A_003192 [Saprospiraceae bacterium]|jgi:hypothetical protein